MIDFLYKLFCLIVGVFIITLLLQSYERKFAFKKGN